MRRLHPRGPASRGVSVDAAGAILGPDCVLVGRTASGFQGLPAVEAGLVQAAVLDPGLPSDWLFDHCRRIATALRQGEVALARIYGLYIPAGELDDAALRRLATLVPLVKAGFDPDEPRIPKGEPGAGPWTYEEGYAKPRGSDGHSGTGSSSGGSGGEPPAAAGDNEPRGDRPPMQYHLPIPAERPATAKDRYAVVRNTARWLRAAAALGALYAPEPRVKAILLAIEGTAWLVEYLPEIRSYYLDGPKSLAELQDAVDDPQPGYENHHIVEAQRNSSNPLNNSARFGRRLDSRENLVRIPKWSHVEISSWYSTSNRIYGGKTPRDFLRGKSWDEQYRVGIEKLRDFGVLK